MWSNLWLADQISLSLPLSIQGRPSPGVVTLRKTSVFLTDLFEVLFGFEAPASRLRLDHFHFWILPFVEALVEAELRGGTHLRVTLVLQRPIHALRFLRARALVTRLAVAAWDFWQVGHTHLHFPYGLVTLSRGENLYMLKYYKLNQQKKKKKCGLKREFLCCTLMSLYGGGRRELRSCSKASLVSRWDFSSWNLFAASSSATNTHTKQRYYKYSLKVQWKLRPLLLPCAYVCLSKERRKKMLYNSNIMRQWSLLIDLFTKFTLKQSYFALSRNKPLKWAKVFAHRIKRIWILKWVNHI